MSRPPLDSSRRQARSTRGLRPRTASALFSLLLLGTAACQRSGVAGREEPPHPAEVRPSGRVRSWALTAAPTTLKLLDGRDLQVWAYDGQVPGPILRATVGDTVRITLRNELPQATTIHWHGVRLPNAMDGVPGVTQPPIPPGGSFTYEFPVKDAGTFWFHPHLRGSEQVERGLYGILIVDEEKPQPFSRELVWVLDDWRLDGTGQIDPRFNTRHDLSHDGRWGEVLTLNGHVRPVVPVKPGERLRVRIINVANGRIFAPDFGELTGKLVAFDALATDRPLPLTGLELSPGNRIDVDLTVPATMSGARHAVVDRFTRRENLLAELEVMGDPVPAPTFTHPVRKSPSLETARRLEPAETFRLNVRQGGPFGLEWTINGEAFRHDDTAAPPGNHDGHGAGHGSTGGSGHHRVYRLPANRWVKLRFVNESFRLHPMHVHGQFFRVVSRDGKPVDESHWRDTVLVRPKETVDVAMFPQDLGAWMLHCHIQEHAESGMMTLVEVKDGP